MRYFPVISLIKLSKFNYYMTKFVQSRPITKTNQTDHFIAVPYISLWLIYLQEITYMSKLVSRFRSAFLLFASCLCDQSCCISNVRILPIPVRRFLFKRYFACLMKRFQLFEDFFFSFLIISCFLKLYEESEILSSHHATWVKARSKSNHSRRITRN